MLKYRGAKLIRAGFLGAVLTVLVTLVMLSPMSLVARATTVQYQALFAEAGGLATGNAVTRSGVKIGTVSDVALRGKAVLVTFAVKSTVPLGSQTSAHIQTGTLLGQRVLTLDSAGSGRLHPHDTIPLTHTSSPYTLTDAVADFTTNTAGTDTAALNQSLDTLSATLDQVAPQIGPAFDGLSRLSRSINSRDETLRELLRHASDVTAILSKRSQKLNTLILNANDLLAVLVERRQAIVDLLARTSAVAKELNRLVADNEAVLAPTLQKLNTVTAMLEKNRDNIAKALPGLRKYLYGVNEGLANGFHNTLFIPNLPPAQFLQPFLDYAFGFRRGTDAGQPPDNAGPRAEFPWPHNAIPQNGGQHP
jgi:phospholipid/cholesterol/gamma-HCH transport system substrate-binding protein